MSGSKFGYRRETGKEIFIMAEERSELAEMIDSIDDKLYDIVDEWKQSRKMREQRHSPLIKEVRSLEISQFSSLAFSPSGSMLACGNAKGSIFLINASTGEIEHTIETSSYKICCICWSSDEKQLAIGGNNNCITIWDLSSKKQIHTLQGHEKNIAAIAWSPDGNRLASSSSDSKVIIWQASTGTKEIELHGHTDWVRCLAWSPDSTKIASAGDDKVIRIWDVAKGKTLHVLQGHTGYILSLAWSPKDSNSIISGNHTGTEYNNRYLKTYLQISTWSPDIRP
jgi:WD40 repeat protein